MCRRADQFASVGEISTIQSGWGWCWGCRNWLARARHECQAAFEIGGSHDLGLDVFEMIE